MKLLAFIFALLVACTPSVRAQEPQETQTEAEGAADPMLQGAAGAVAAAADVSVTLCLNSGDVVVRGGERSEVRARAAAAWIELRPVAAASSSMGGTPARALEVLLAESADASPGPGGCNLSGSVELEVPRGARVLLRVREGDVDVSDVAEARVELMNGDASLRRVARASEVESLSGSVFLRDSTGRVSLRTMSGDIEASSVGANAASGTFSARSTSGDLVLERIGHARVEASTVSGDVQVSGALARGGSYDFKTFSGDVLLSVPADSSFRVNAKVAPGGEILSDFAVKPPHGAPAAAATTDRPAPPDTLRGLVGAATAGAAAEVNLTSFNGTVRLKRQ